MFNWIPERFRSLKDPLDTYFAMARGTKDAVSSEMTKWFNTNYHYIVPEYEKAQNSNSHITNRLKLYEKVKKAFGVETKPVVLGLYTFVSLSKGYEANEVKEIQQRLVPLYT